MAHPWRVRHPVSRNVGHDRNMTTARHWLCIALLLQFVARVSAAPQIVLVTTNDQNTLVYIVDDGAKHQRADDCAKYCWNRSSSISRSSRWGNTVELFFNPELSADRRQLVGDWFVANYVYPRTLYWVENGHTNQATYGPSTVNLEKIRKWRQEAPEPRLRNDLKTED